jgi:N-acetylglutamate synthase-like GNAT family acetyltransferase
MPAVRRATPADAQAVTEVARAAFATYVPRLGVEPWPMTVDYADLIDNSEVWVVEDDGDAVGVLVLEDHPDHLLLDIVAVSPDRQGSGTGTWLLELADRRARELGHAEVRLFTNEQMTENLAYYARHGYTETHRDEVDGFHRVFFVRRL